MLLRTEQQEVSLPDAVLVSNIPHYHHLAAALWQSGRLQRYITCPSLFEGDSPPAFLTEYWQRKLAGRALYGLPRDTVRQLVVPEALQKGLPRLRVFSSEQADWVNNQLFDLLARRSVEECRVLHFVSSVGLYCARKAKRWGSHIVCDVRQEHPGFQRQILEEESQLLGIPFSLAGTSYESKVLEEFELADHLVVPSSHAKRTFIERGFAPERVIQLPYGVDHSLFPTTIAATRIEPFRILFVGAIIPRKGIHYLLEAFRRIQRKDMELVLVGPLPPEMEPFLRRNAGYFTHLPVVPRVDLGGIYGRSSVFVLPSLADAFPLVALEAMASGLPVIITENTGTRDFVTDGKEGFIVPIRDVEAIQEKLEYLYLHREAASEMGRRANAMVGNLTWQKYRESAISLYENFR